MIPYLCVYGLIVYLLISTSAFHVAGADPCPLGPEQKESRAVSGVAVTPSATHRCGDDFKVSMDINDGEPSVVLLSFEESVLNNAGSTVTLEVFVTGSGYGRPNITVLGVPSLRDTQEVSWDMVGFLKPFKPKENMMATCSDNVVKWSKDVFKVGYLIIPDPENLSDQGGIPISIDVSNAIRRGIHTFALVKIIECRDLKDDIRGNYAFSSLCTDDTYFHGKQFPPRLIIGSPPPPPPCSFKRGYYKIEMRNTRTIRTYFLTHSLRSKDRRVYITSSRDIDKIPPYQQMWKINGDSVSGKPMTLFAVKRRSKYSYLGGTAGGGPSLGTKKEKIRLIPRPGACSTTICNRLYLVSDPRKKKGIESYLRLDLRNATKMKLSWKFFKDIDPWYDVVELVPSF